MVELRLARLPERTPVKITITASPDLDLALRQYAGLYRAAYGQAESVAELIPFMLEAFLESDRGFTKARREGTMPTPPSPRRRREPAEPASPAALIKEE